jgi:flagellar hook-associated protein 2
VSVLSTGQLSFDQSKLRSVLASSRDNVEKLFSAADTGLGAHFYSTLDSITNDTTGTIKHKDDAYDSQVQVFQSQIDTLNTRLSSEQTRLYNQFYNMETVLAQLQTQKSVVDNLPSASVWNTSSTSKSSG